jgi:hypothetical protein
MVDEILGESVTGSKPLRSQAVGPCSIAGDLSRNALPAVVGQMLLPARIASALPRSAFAVALLACLHLPFASTLASSPSAYARIEATA